MKKKAIEKIPYFGLKKTSRKKRCQIHWCHGGQDCWTRKASFPGGIQEQKESKEMPMVRIVLTKRISAHIGRKRKNGRGRK